MKFSVLIPILLGNYFSAQGAVITRRNTTSGHPTPAPRRTPSPNDVLEPSVQAAPPIKENSSKTDLLIGALGVTSVILPYLDEITSYFKNKDVNEVDPALQTVSQAVAHTDNVSRRLLSVQNRPIIDEIEDTFIGSINPFGVFFEVASILVDVFAFTQEQGLTDFQNLSRHRRDILFEQEIPYTGSDSTSRFPLAITNHVSILNFRKFYPIYFSLDPKLHFKS